MRVWSRVVILGLVQIISNSYAVAVVDQAGEVWHRMQVAAHELNYAATLTMVSHRQVSTLRRVHVRVDGHEWQRLISLDGERREVQTGQGRAMFFEGNGLTTSMLQTRHVSVAGLTSPLPSNLYVTRLLMNQRLGGRFSQELQLQPRDTWRYGLNLWVDNVSGLLLREEVTQGDHRLLVLSVTDLKVGPKVGLAEFRRAASPGVAPPAIRPAPAAGVPCLPWGVRLPPGFQLIAIHHQAINGAVVDEARYSDGLATVSVFVAQAPANLSRYQQPALHHWGAMTTAEQLRQGGKNTYLVSVLGNVPARTVLEMLATWQVVMSPTCAKHY